jgi:hypothetical protein
MQSLKRLQQIKNMIISVVQRQHTKIGEGMPPANDACIGISIVVPILHGSNEPLSCLSAAARPPPTTSARTNGALFYGQK